jgi:hypothetical protein
MSQMTPLPIAVRIYPEAKTLRPDNARPTSQLTKIWRRPNAMLVFDTETRIDETQRLMVGSYRFFTDGVCQEEGLFFADDVAAHERVILDRYVKEHRAEATDTELKLLPLREFLSKFYLAAYKGRCLLVGFNLSFDLSRLARYFATARGRFAGGFSLGFWSYTDGSGSERENRYRPRVAIKQIDSKRALRGFTARNECDPTDLIPDGSPSGEPEAGFKFRGNFLDLRTLAFALTDEGYKLKSACEDFGVEHGKQSAKHLGKITKKYIDYNRRDVLATAELASKLLAEYDKHPIKLQPTKAYSPASIGKAYLQEMGIQPILDRQPDFPKAYLGYAQSAFFGGRASAHIRKTAVPVVYTDFLSMYPTVNSLMGLWQFVTARKITAEHCQKEMTEFLNKVSTNYLFTQDSWKELAAFVQIIPDGDILPSRSKYSAASNDWQVAVNHIYSDAANPSALWYSLPDVVASVILTGRVPKVIDAFRLKASGRSDGLKPTRLRGSIEVSPRQEDFFKFVIEERKRLPKLVDVSQLEKRRLDKSLKVTANATSYGIYAEMNRQESDEKISVTCHGIDPKPFTCKVLHPEVPGKYCFPPLASLITGGARLMLALLEKAVTELGGTYAMEDTDSMAVVATQRGGVLPCPGGPYVISSQDQIKALSWKQVEDIAARFAALNPYDRSAIPGSILEIESDNFDPKTRKQRQLYCLAISAKRYALFLKDRQGTPELLRKGPNNGKDQWSEHGLGHLLNPTDPESDDRQWIGQAWLNIVRKALGMPAQNLEFVNRPAIGRVTVSGPAVIRPLANLNEDKPYPEQIKPFNFLLTCHVKAFGHPTGADPERFHLIAPYDDNSTRWLKMKWIDQYTGSRYQITTAGHSGSRRTVRVKTFGDVLREYEFHPESKCADAGSNPCEKQTVGLLRRRHIRITQVKFIGKESNQLEAVDAGLIHCDENIYTEYIDQSRDEWQTKILPALKLLPLSRLISESGLSRRALLDIRAGRSRPHAKNQKSLSNIVRCYGVGIE